MALAMAGMLFLPLSSHASDASDWQYVTVPGDTLIGIGQRYLRNPADWPKIQSENRVDVPKRMPANFRLRIPVRLLKVTPAPVTVTSVNGNVRVKGADGRFQPLQANARLIGGETVITGPRSSAAFRFADGTSLTQQASSRLGFGRLAAYGNTGMIATELSLEAGRLEASAAKQLAPAGGFSVRTPVAVAGLRGTGFRLNVAEDGQRMTNEVMEGSVAVSARGRAVAVNAGYGTFTEAGKAPVQPRALLAPPDLSAMPSTIQRQPLQFTKPPQAGAVAWRARVVGDESHGSVLLDDVFTGPTAQWNDNLPDGTYYLLARAIDEAGLEGMESVHAFVLDVHPMPPVPIAPALGERLYPMPTAMCCRFPPPRNSTTACWSASCPRWSSTRRPWAKASGTGGWPAWTTRAGCTCSAPTGPSSSNPCPYPLPTGRARQRAARPTSFGAR